METLLRADWRVRVLLLCTTVLVAANAAAVTARLGLTVMSDRDPDVVIIEEGTVGTVLIVGADGTTVSIDPSTPEGRAAIAAAEERGDTIVTAPPNGDGTTDADAGDHLAATPGQPGAAKASDLDAADGVVDGVVQVIDETTGELVQRTVDEDGDGDVDRPSPTTPATPGDGEPLVEVTTPGVTVTTPGVTVTTPGVTVTTPGVTVTTPGVTVTTPVTTIVVPTTTVTVPTTTVTVPTTTVTVPTTTVTVPPVTVTVTVPPTTTPPTTLPDLGI